MTTPTRRRWTPQLDSRERPSIEAEVLEGLLASRKTLPAKLLYDARGADLFEQITQLDEYYLTRTEINILQSRASEIAELAGPGVALIEYGSGAGIKVRLLLDALEQPAAYIPIDIAGEQLARVARELQAEYPDVKVLPLAADYSRPVSLPPLPESARRIAFFPGSTLGNMHPDDAALFLARVRRTVGKSGGLILGVDRVKPAAVLEAAYNDADGVTATFNLNLLVRINQELGGDFDLSAFEHRAIWNSPACRVEMHLVSLREQVVRVSGEVIAFDRRETIWTSSAYKYHEASLARLVIEGGFEPAQLWTDPEDRFWVGFFTAL